VPIRELVRTPKMGELPWPKKQASLFRSHVFCMAKLEDFGFSKEEIEKETDTRSFPFHGGERNAVRRMQQYIFGKKAIDNYAHTKEQLLGRDYSSKLSPWLANGSLSIRRLYHSIINYE
jgi:deoxyribodipyrimidine photo-lyase